MCPSCVCCGKFLISTDVFMAAAVTIGKVYREKQQIEKLGGQKSDNASLSFFFNSILSELISQDAWFVVCGAHLF